MNYSRRSVLPGWLNAVIAFTFVVSGIVVTAFVFLTADAFLGRPLNPLAEAAEAVSDINLDPLNQDGGLPAVPTALAGVPLPSPFPTNEFAEANQRVNILVMGIDRRPGEAFISRTDTMMLVSIDPETESASILSIPRDLYVVIPGRGRDRINTAFVYGSVDNNPAGGALLAMQTVEYNLGVYIDHYVLVDFSAVINGINELGGIDVYVPYNINDPTFPDMNYGFDPLFIPAGQNHFDGLTALKYARTRHQDNDFYRARRQQQVVLAVRDKALALGLPTLIGRAPSLFNQFEQGIRTDLSLQQIIELAQIVGDIPDDNIRNEVLDHNYVSNYLTENGASVLIPINEAIEPLIRQLFYNS